MKNAEFVNLQGFFSHFVYDLEDFTYALHAFFLCFSPKHFSTTKVLQQNHEKLVDDYLEIMPFFAPVYTANIFKTLLQIK